MRLVIIYCAALALFFSSCDDESLNHRHEFIGNVPVLDIYIVHNDYLVLLTNRNINFEVPCKICYTGKYYDAEIRSAGSGSRYLPKWTYKVSLKNGAKIEGLGEFNLSPQAYDKTMLKSAVACLAYSAAGLAVNKNSHAFLRINNENAGLYLMQERIDRNFFYSRKLTAGELFELGFKSKLSFIGKDFFPEETVRKIIPGDNNLDSFIELIRLSDTCSPDNVFTVLGESLDINLYLRYHAVSSLLNNWDGFENNMHLWREKPGCAFKVIPWDFDKCFDEELSVGLAGKNGLANKIFQNDGAAALYKMYVKFLLDNVFTEDKIYAVIDSVSAAIEEGYNLDPYLGNGRYVFTEEKAQLKQYIRERMHFFKNYIDLFDKNSYFRK